MSLLKKCRNGSRRNKTSKKCVSYKRGGSSSDEVKLSGPDIGYLYNIYNDKIETARKPELARPLDQFKEKVQRIKYNPNYLGDFYEQKDTPEDDLYEQVKSRIDMFIKGYLNDIEQNIEPETV
jgi:hypothetical protein